jgi:hypothetical protein
LGVSDRSNYVKIDLEVSVNDTESVVF